MKRKRRVITQREAAKRRAAKERFHRERELQAEITLLIRRVATIEGKRPGHVRFEYEQTSDLEKLEAMGQSLLDRLAAMSENRG